MIGFMPAWRAIPAGMGAGIESACDTMNNLMTSPSLDPATTPAKLSQVFAALSQDAGTAASKGAPGAPAATSSSQATLMTANVALTATYTAAAAVPGGEPAARTAYTEGIKAAAAAAMSAAMSAMAGMADMHICPIPVPIPPHGPGFVTKGSKNVFINNLPACRQGDKVLEAAGGSDPIAMGCQTVLIGDSGGGGGGAGAPGASASQAGASTVIDAAPAGYSGTGGTAAYSDSKTEAKTGVTLVKDGTATTYTDAISIQVKCDKDPHVVQFISREIIGADGKPIKRKMKTTGGEYETTIDPKNPVWNTDSAGKPNPYYESAGASRTDPGSLTIYDQPGLLPAAGETWRATFRAFLICDGKVIREVTWVRSMKAGEKATYTVNVKEASSLPAWAKDTLKKQGYNAAP
ncbi:MAG: PAAR domain-containing protein [Planctomycetota bacterium]